MESEAMQSCDWTVSPLRARNAASSLWKAHKETPFLRSLAFLPSFSSYSSVVSCISAASTFLKVQSTVSGRASGFHNISPYEHEGTHLVESCGRASANCQLRPIHKRILHCHIHTVGEDRVPSSPFSSLRAVSSNLTRGQLSGTPWEHRLFNTVETRPSSRVIVTFMPDGKDERFVRGTPKSSGLADFQ
jgi:hypothetical protein